MDSFESFKAMQRQGWAHFAPLEAITTIPAGRLVKKAGVHAGQRVLDVACGTGVVSVTAARLGARVTGLDLTPELLVRARENSSIAGVEVEWLEGDVEQIPFADGTFDVVLSQYGHIFAPRPEVAIVEMLRVLKPGGTIAFSTWPPELIVSQMFALAAQYLPPPPAGVAPPPLWGDPNIVRQRLGHGRKRHRLRSGDNARPRSQPSASPGSHRTDRRSAGETCGVIVRQRSRKAGRLPARVR